MFSFSLSLEMWGRWKHGNDGFEDGFFFGGDGEKDGVVLTNMFGVFFC